MAAALEQHRETMILGVEHCSQKKFEHVIHSGVSLINFNASWCHPCRVQELILDALKKDYRGRATVVIINIDENRDLAYQLGIQSIPTMIIFKEGREMERFIGLQTAETLDRALKQALL
jgi:thioredoxin 1